MKGLLLALAVLIAFGIAGRMDYEDALAESEHYCAMVNEGTWPNYKNQECEQ